jgi:hypothetical protein
LDEGGGMGGRCDAKTGLWQVSKVKRKYNNLPDNASSSSSRRGTLNADLSRFSCSLSKKKTILVLVEACKKENVPFFLALQNYFSQTRWFFGLRHSSWKKI